MREDGTVAVARHTPIMPVPPKDWEEGRRKW